MVEGKDARGANNYTEYSLNPYFRLSDFRIETSFDFITLSGIDPRLIQPLFRFFHGRGCRVLYDVILEKGHFLRKRTYVIEEGHDEVIDVLYGIKDSFRGRPTLLLTIRHCTEKSIGLLTTFFKDFGIEPKASVIEISFDFYTDLTIDLSEYIRFHLLFKHQHSKSFFDKGTFYTNDVRKSTKGMRLYTKQPDAFVKFVRLELILRRHAIRRLGLSFPIDPTRLSDLNKFFTFATLDIDKLKKYFIRKNINKIREIDSRRPGMGVLVIRGIDAWLNTFIGYQESFMGMVEVLKSKDRGVPNFERFIKPLDHLNDHFRELKITS